MSQEIYTTKPVFSKIKAAKVWITIDPGSSGDFLRGEKIVDDGWTFTVTDSATLTVSTASYAPRKTPDEGGLTFRVEEGDVQADPNMLRVTLQGDMGSYKIYDLEITVSA